MKKTYFGEYSRVEDSVAMALGLRMGDAVAFTGKINDFSSISIFAQGPEADYLIKMEFIPSLESGFTEYTTLKT